MPNVKCVKLHKELPGLDKPPMAGELGRRIHEQVSQEAWEGWLEHQKMIMNEYRMDLSDKEHRKLLKQQCEKYFFGEGAELPKDFKPE